ncbi:hypothetical protein KCU78_g13541, partial [Aureobasidium melanogenum]
MQKLCEEMKAAKERDREEIRVNIQANNDECRALEAKKNRLANDQRNQTRNRANRLEEMLKQQEAKLAAVQAQHKKNQQKMFRRQEAKLSAVQAKHEKTQEGFNSFKAQVEADRQVCGAIIFDLMLSHLVAISRTTLDFS